MYFYELHLIFIVSSIHDIMKSFNEHVEISREEPLKISVFESVKLKYPFHYHTGEYELTLTLGSTGVRLVGDHIGEFGESDLVLIGPGIPHCWLNNFSDNPEKQTNIMVVVIHFSKHLFTNELLGKPILYDVRQLLEFSLRGIQFNGKILDEITDDILKLKIDPDFGTIVQLYSIFDRLSRTTEYTLLSSPGYHFSGKKEDTEKFERIYEYILDHFRDRIMIGEVSELADMNDSAFSHYFKKRTSKSFTDFINELRLNFACHLLTDGNKNIAEICYESGFNNLSNFNRIFKKQKGITPNHWRKRTQPLI